MNTKRMKRSLVLGAGFAIALLLAGNAGIAADLASTLLFPGLAVASVFKFGAHDIETIGVMLMVDSFLYGGAAFLISAVGGMIRSGGKNRGM